jgi:hypothetical protein
MAQRATRSDTPAPISLNLDSLEREGAPGPFVVVLGGDRYTFLDAQEIDWQDLQAALGDPRTFLRLVLPEGQGAKFLSLKVATHKIRRLIDNYREHFGLVAPGE